MNKRKLRHQLSILRRLPTIALLAAAVFFALVAVFTLRANNQKMIDLRDAVYAADEEDGDIEGALRELREHVYSHMNTNLSAGENAIYPPIQLKYTYDRLVGVEQAKASGGNEGLYTEAQEYCEEKLPTAFYGRDKLPCIREYLDSHGVAVNKEVSIPEDLYKFNFESPSWSPDLAGWSLVLSVLFGLLFVGRAAAEYVMKYRLNN